MAEGREFDVIVLGAGAAGLMCAIEAGKRGRRVVVLERAEKPGKKILISGGGRCNFTNLHWRPENFLSGNPHFAKSALARYTPRDFIALVEKHGIAYHEKTLGQLFCDGSAQEIVSMLLRECEEAGVEIESKCSVQSAKCIENPTLPTPVRAGHPRFCVGTDKGDFTADALVVATGGLSIPKIGATSFGYELARQFGLKIVEPWPGLVPFVFAEKDRKDWCDLAGVSAEVVVAVTSTEIPHLPPKTGGRVGQPRFREKMLITHRGLSGPAILQASSYWRPGESITIDLAPEKDVTRAMRESAANRNLNTLKTALRAALPNRLADRWAELHAPARWTNAALGEFERELHAWKITPAGTEGFDKAEVTAGGVDTDELSAQTMKAKKVPGLYFVGEVVDVTGWLGGFNFQWAWASGVAAGRAV